MPAVQHEEINQIQGDLHLHPLNLVVSQAHLQTSASEMEGLQSERASACRPGWSLPSLHSLGESIVQYVSYAQTPF